MHHHLMEVQDQLQHKYYEINKEQELPNIKKQKNIDQLNKTKKSQNLNSKFNVNYLFVHIFLQYKDKMKIYRYQQ